MELEDRIGALLGDSVRELPVPVAVIVAEAGRQGRRRRSRRRAAQLAGATLATAAVVWTGAAIDLHRAPAAPAAADVVGENVLGTLADLLPSGASLREVVTPPETHGLTVRYDDGRSPVTLTVDLAPGPGCTDCTRTRLGDGTTETSERLADGVRVRAHHPDGSEVELTVRPAEGALPLWQQVAASPRWSVSWPVH
ncbi:hypothetical protein ABT095_22140 [Kitasatospora sp. NPDC002227]|uniref:hypothetical protein n=1 Tax=Kitasatospora sp. NPDC002227 TaxID=3154773 RepID=UPI0033246C42